MSSDESCSSRSSSTSSDGSELVVQGRGGNVVTPWRFEPVRRRTEVPTEVNEEDSEESDERVHEQDRLQNSEW